MNEQRYMISDASKQLDVEPHVLRYWEEELEMEIPRNEMGHRCYSESNVRILKSVKELKQQGFQLKAIKLLMPELITNDGQNVERLLGLKDEFNQKAEAEEKRGAFTVVEPQDEVEIFEETAVEVAPLEDAAEVVMSKESRMEQFQSIMNKVVANAIIENSKTLGQAMGGEVSTSMLQEVNLLMRHREEREEERFKKLDETLRNMQQRTKLEAAAAMEVKQIKKRRKKGLFRR